MSGRRSIRSSIHARSARAFVSYSARHASWRQAQLLRSHDTEYVKWSLLVSSALLGSKASWQPEALGLEGRLEQLSALSPLQAYNTITRQRAPHILLDLDGFEAPGARLELLGTGLSHLRARLG